MEWTCATCGYFERDVTKFWLCAYSIITVYAVRRTRIKRELYFGLYSTKHGHTFIKLSSICVCLACRALCYLALKMLKDAISDCNEALRLDSGNIKALYRRAQAYKELKVRFQIYESFWYLRMFDCNIYVHITIILILSMIVFFPQNKNSCLEDLNSLLKVEPNNMAAQNLLEEVQKMK